MWSPPRQDVCVEERLTIRRPIEKDETFVAFALRMTKALGKKAPLTLIFRNATPKATLEDYVEDKFPESPAGKKPAGKDYYIKRWFEQHGVDISNKQLKDRTLRYVRPNDELIILSSVFGKKYYDKFLDTLSVEERELVSPFYADRGWVALSFDSKEETDAWLRHLPEVEEKCPKRKAGPFKDLMTRELELRVPIFADDLRVEPAMKRLYADMTSEYKALGFDIFEEQENASGNASPEAEVPKAKIKKKRPPPEADIPAEPSPPEKRPALVLRISREHFPQVRSVENMFDFDPYDESDLSINDTIL